MKSDVVTRVSEIACNFALTETGFSIAKMVGIECANMSSEQDIQIYTVRLALSYSQAEIDKLASEGSPEEESLKRDFLKGDVFLNLTIKGDFVLSSSWDGIDFV
jgi:hypothetical protein